MALSYLQFFKVDKIMVSNYGHLMTTQRYFHIQKLRHIISGADYIKKFSLLIFEVIFSSSSESSQPLSDRQQITFVMHNRFWLLSKNLLTPPPILNRQYQAGWNANQD